MASGYGSNEPNDSRVGSKRVSPLTAPFLGEQVEELAVWRSKMVVDIGRDVKAVFRDFPRMLVFVSSGTRDNFEEVNESFIHGSNYPVNKTMKPIFSAPEEAAAVNSSVFQQRCVRVKNTVLLITELCNERSTFGSLFEQAWDRKLEELSHHDPQRMLADGVDIHTLLEYAVLTSGMAEKLKNSGSEAIEEAGDSSGCTEGEPRGSWRIHAKTFASLLLTVQGVMFYPSQYLLNSIQTPWLGHMQDSGWTIHIYPEYGKGKSQTGCICAQHSQLARHHVERKHLRKVPRFELEYTCTIRLNLSAFHASIPAEKCKDIINRVDFDLVACRLAKPRCSCCLRTWESRVRELTDKVEEHFGIHVVPSSSI